MYSGQEHIAFVIVELVPSVGMTYLRKKDELILFPGDTETFLILTLPAAYDIWGLSRY